MVLTLEALVFYLNEIKEHSNLHVSLLHVIRSSSADHMGDSLAKQRADRLQELTLINMHVFFM